MVGAVLADRADTGEGGDTFEVTLGAFFVGAGSALLVFFAGGLVVGASGLVAFGVDVGVAVAFVEAEGVPVVAGPGRPVPRGASAGAPVTVTAGRGDAAWVVGPVAQIPIAKEVTPKAPETAQAVVDFENGMRTSWLRTIPSLEALEERPMILR